MFKQTAFAVLVLANLGSGGIYAAKPSTSEATVRATDSVRLQKRSGMYLGVLGDPAPTLVGLNAAYNVTDFLRASFGIGRVSAGMGEFSASATTIGIGAKALVPGWNLSPVAGLGVSYVLVSASPGINVSGFGANGANVYANIGVDWQTASGFNLGAGYNLSLVNGSGAPYINLGWFADFFQI